MVDVVSSHTVRVVRPVAAFILVTTAACSAHLPADHVQHAVDANEGEGAVASEGEGVEASGGEGEGVGVSDGAGEGEGAASQACTGQTVPECALDASSGDFNCTLEHDGLTRSYILHVPSSYAQRAASGAELVLNFHGVRTSASLQRYFSRMNDVSDADGFVLVYPEGTGPSTDESWNAGFCCDSASANNVDDVGFAVAIVDRLSSSLCIDPKRVYATGLSNGGHMAYRLACERADVFAAIASVAGVVTVSPCSPTRPVPILHFHGTSDPIVNYDFGIDGVNGAKQTVAAWAERDGCSTNTDVVYQNGNATCVANTGCSAGSDVELCTIEGGGHQWPGGNSIPLLGANTTDIDASSTIAAFFAAHPMP